MTFTRDNKHQNTRNNKQKTKQTLDITNTRYNEQGILQTLDMTIDIHNKQQTNKHQI